MADSPNLTADELSEIADAAATLPFDPSQEDSDEPEELEEQPEEEEDDLEDSEEESEDTEEDLDDEEDPEDSDEEDEDSLEDDEDSEEDDESEDDEEEDDEDDESEGTLDFDPNLVIRRPDGSQATLQELHEGYLRQEDYTQKTQRVADAYRKMEQWYSQRAQNPPAWVAEIAYGDEDPASVIAGALRETGDATNLFTQTVKHLVEQGDLPDEIVEALNLTELAEQAKEGAIYQKVQSLEQQLYQRDAYAAQQAQMQQVEQKLNDQWSNVVRNDELQFADENEAFTVKNQVLQYALQQGIPNLETAWAAMKAQNLVPQTGAKTAKKSPKKKAAQQAVKKKRKTSAMSRKPTGGSKTKPKQGGSDNIVGEAAAEALAELGIE